MLQGFISLFSTPARAYACILGIVLFVVYVVIWRMRVFFARYSDGVAEEYSEKGNDGFLKRFFLNKRLNDKQSPKKKKIVSKNKSTEKDEENIDTIKELVGEMAYGDIAMKKEMQNQIKKSKEIAEKKKEVQKSAEIKKKEIAEKQKAEEKRIKEEEEKRREEESLASEEELEGLRNEGRRVMEEMASRIAEYEQKYQSYEQMDEILSYKEDIKDIESIKDTSDLDRLLGRQHELEVTFDWHKDMDISKNPAVVVKEVSLNEEQIKSFLDNMLSELVPLVDRGWSDAQITRSLTSKTDYQIPAHEIVPMLESVRSCLGILDSKAVSAKIKYTDANYDIASARSALLRGDTREAIRIMEDRMRLLEKTADSLVGSEKTKMLEQSADLSRDIAVLTKVTNIKESFNHINHSLALNHDNIKTLSVFGYMNLRNNDLYGAEKAFTKALENANQNEYWAKIARDGMDRVNGLKDEERKSLAVEMEKKKEKELQMNERQHNMDRENLQQMHKSMYRLRIVVREHQHTR